MHRNASRTALARVAPLALLAALVASACGDSEARRAGPEHAPDIQAFDPTSLHEFPDSLASRRDASAAARMPLSPLADSIANRVTFLATFQRTFVAAGRDRRLLADVGRVDTRVETPERMRAYREAATARAPLAVGDRLRLHGTWGASDATVAGYDIWNGRAVATLELPASVDSVVRHADPVVSLAVLADSAALPAVDVCNGREKLSGMLAARAAAVGDSLVAALRGDSTAGSGGPASKVTRLAGCFGDFSAVIFANLAATARRPAREIAVLLDDRGSPSVLSVRDRRFVTHEALLAFDADGDGVDDVAALGRADRSGGTVVLRLDPDGRRLEYVASGFAWENF